MEEKLDFWDNISEATAIQKEKAAIQDVIENDESLQNFYEEFEILFEYAVKDDDLFSATKALEVSQKFVSEFLKIEQKILLGGEVDINNAIVYINSGAGGTESCDWANMLQRMIIRWAEGKGMKIQILDTQAGDEAGLKSSLILIQGNYAYGLLKGESGVHRLVRISPFDSSSRRHTSFASIFVSPEIDDDIEIEINENDLRIDVYRSGGAGGQSVNTTDSAVRITHRPTGIVVTCQNERSQLQNKIRAMKVLRSRLFELELAKRKMKENEIEAGKKKIEWGSQIRSYVLHPYKMIKDHRTHFETGQVDKVLDGGLDDLLNSFLRWSSEYSSK